MSNGKPFDADAYLALMAPLADIPVQPEWEAGIKTFLRAAAAMAEQLRTAPLDENALDLACRFVPGTPPLGGPTNIEEQVS